MPFSNFIVRATAPKRNFPTDWEIRIVCVCYSVIYNTVKQTNIGETTTNIETSWRQATAAAVAAVGNSTSFPSTRTGTLPLAYISHCRSSLAAREDVWSAGGPGVLLLIAPPRSCLNEGIRLSTNRRRPLRPVSRRLSIYSSTANPLASRRSPPTTNNSRTRFRRPRRPRTAGPIPTARTLWSERLRHYYYYYYCRRSALQKRNCFIDVLVISDSRDPVIHYRWILPRTMPAILVVPYQNEKLIWMPSK